MIIYHPMFDPYHCALRMCYTIKDSEITEMEWDRLRLLDFYVMFPHLIAAIRLPRELRSSRAMLKLSLPYESYPEPTRLFLQLSVIQDTSVRLLAAGGLIHPESLEMGNVAATDNDLRGQLDELGKSLSYRDSEWYSVLIKRIGKLPLNGKNGLKERTGLMEFRHDPG